MPNGAKPTIRPPDNRRCHGFEAVEAVETSWITASSENPGQASMGLRRFRPRKRPPPSILAIHLAGFNS